MTPPLTSVHSAAGFPGSASGRVGLASELPAAGDPQDAGPSLARLATLIEATIPAGWPCLYLLHFEQKRYHAQHYLGSSLDWERRLTQHATGRGARLTRALWADDEAWTLAALFIPRDPAACIRALERIAKRRHSSGTYCPLCTANHTSPRGTVQYPAPRVSSLDLRNATQCTTLISPTTVVSAKTAKKVQIN